MREVARGLQYRALEIFVVSSMWFDTMIEITRLPSRMARTTDEHYGIVKLSKRLMCTGGKAGPKVTVYGRCKTLEGRLQYWCAGGPMIGAARIDEAEGF